MGWPWVGEEGDWASWWVWELSDPCSPKGRSPCIGILTSPQGNILSINHYCSNSHSFCPSPSDLLLLFLIQLIILPLPFLLLLLVTLFTGCFISFWFTLFASPTPSAPSAPYPVCYYLCFFSLHLNNAMVCLYSRTDHAPPTNPSSPPQFFYILL